MLLIVSPPIGTTLKEVGELFPPAVYLVHSFYQAVAIKLYLVLDFPQPPLYVVVTALVFPGWYTARPHMSAELKNGVRPTAMNCPASLPAINLNL